MQTKVTLYIWAGKKGPFEIKSHCEDCDLHAGIIKNLLEKHFKGKQVSFEIKPWLDNFFTCLFAGTWHPPIIHINGRKFYQYSHKHPLFKKDDFLDAVNRGLAA